LPPLAAVYPHLPASAIGARAAAKLVRVIRTVMRRAFMAAPFVGDVERRLGPAEAAVVRGDDTACVTPATLSNGI
jgi:hypothetical protein